MRLGVHFDRLSFSSYQMSLSAATLIPKYFKAIVLNGSFGWLVPNIAGVNCYMWVIAR